MLGLKMGLTRQQARPNLVTNGDFTDDISGWNAHNGAILAHVDDAMTVDSNGSSIGQAHQTFPTIAGATYRASCTLSSGGIGGQFAVSTSFAASGNIASQNGSGAASVKSFTFTATGTTTYVRLSRLSAATGNPVTFDNVTVRQI